MDDTSQIIEENMQQGTEVSQEEQLRTAEPDVSEEEKMRQFLLRSRNL